MYDSKGLSQHNYEVLEQLNLICCFPRITFNLYTLEILPVCSVNIEILISYFCLLVFWQTTQAFQHKTEALF